MMSCHTWKNRLHRGVFGLCSLLLANPARADFITIDFNDAFPSYPASFESSRFDDFMHRYSPYQASGIVMTAPDQGVTVYQSDFANTWFEANLASVSGRSNPSVAVNGSGIMRPGRESGQFVVTSDSSRPFTVQSMDLLMGFDNGEIGATVVNFEGYREGTLVGALSLTLNWHGMIGGLPPGADVGWTSADLRALSGIDELVITGVPTMTAPPNVSELHVGNSAEFWVDNVRVHSVPEPATLALFAVGAFGFLSSSLRRRH